MAAQNRIGRLTKRIDALASRRLRRLHLDDLTHEGWAKLEQLTAATPPVSERHPDCSHWTTHALFPISHRCRCPRRQDFEAHTDQARAFRPNGGGLYAERMSANYHSLR